jgi:phage terminase large subunit
MLNYFNSERGYNASLRVQKSNPPIKERLAVLRGYIKNAKGFKRLYVDSSCKWLLYNFEECKNNLGNAGLHIPTDSEIQNDDNKRFLIHPIDAMSYPIYYLNNLREKTGEDYTSRNM